MDKIHLSFNPLLRCPYTRNGYHIAITPQGDVYRYSDKTSLPYVLHDGRILGGPDLHLSFAIPSTSPKQLAKADKWSPEKKEEERRKTAAWRYLGAVCKRSLFLVDSLPQFSDTPERPMVMSDELKQLTDDERVIVIHAINGLKPEERPSAIDGYYFNHKQSAFVPR